MGKCNQLLFQLFNLFLQTAEACPLPLGTKRMADLELCLYQRLTEVHAANSNVGNVPTPTSLSLRYPKKYRQAGFRLVSEEELVETPEERYII